VKDRSDEESTERRARLKIAGDMDEVEEEDDDEARGRDGSEGVEVGPRDELVADRRFVTAAESCCCNVGSAGIG